MTQRDREKRGLRRGAPARLDREVPGRAGRPGGGLSTQALKALLERGRPDPKVQSQSQCQKQRAMLALQEGGAGREAAARTSAAVGHLRSPGRDQLMSAAQQRGISAGGAPCTSQ